MGKYIIEIEDRGSVALSNGHPFQLYKAKQFKTLVFDAEGLSRLEKVESKEPDYASRIEKSYEKGLEDAWDAAKRIVLPCAKFANAFSGAELVQIFNEMSSDEILLNHSPADVLDKIQTFDRTSNIKLVRQIRRELKDFADRVGVDNLQQFVDEIKEKNNESNRT